MLSRRRFVIIIIILSITLLGLSSVLIYKLYSSSSQKTSSLTQAEEIVASCRESNDQELCYAQLMGSITKKGSLDHSLQLLSEVEVLDPQVRGCHLIAHFISGAEAEKDISKWEDVLASVPVNACSGGFIHGVLESRQKYDKSFVINAQTIPQICEIIKQKTGSLGSDSNCAHIMGHLSLDVTKGSIPEAVEICESLPESMLYECASGVYMENETRDNVYANGYLPRIPWNPQTTTDQANLCNKEDNPVAQKACWRELAHMIAFVSRSQPRDVYAQCRQAPTEESVQECYRHGVGIMISNSRFDSKNLEYICEPYLSSEHNFRLCYMNAIGSLMSSSARLSDRAIGLCNVVPLAYATDCFTNLGKQLSRITKPEERKELCQTAPDVYKSRCTYGEL